MSAHVERTVSRTRAPVRFISIDGGVTTVAYSYKVKILVASFGLDWATFVSAWVDGIITDWIPSEMMVVCQGLQAAVEKREGDKVSPLELKQWVLQELYAQLNVAWKGDEERVVKAMGGWGDEFAERILSAASVSILSRRDEVEDTEEEESQ
ncbi:hypothetical protein MPH_04035 [Macrophomina phaseolina MS6]|uniref:Uncharacterized protein n=1 Tax=Macrophomina phaseolina (strain MS6) TaxID=1126212 RepID=K2S8F6_MACPH|nr:hypothetical protein MPH_04035 [Macrophomina phaseolina MS6]